MKQAATIIIAEAGVNHNGDINIALELVDAASAAGADYVKFQTFSAHQTVTADAPKAEYQQRNASKIESQLRMLKNLELTPSQHFVLKDHCRKRGIGFLSTGFDLDSLKLLTQLDMDFFKIPSGEINNGPLLRCIASFDKPVLLSTGMSFLGEVEWAVNFLEDSGLAREKITVLHCTSQYPAMMSDINLNALVSMKSALHIDVGYSDHTLGLEVPIAAVALGAKVIEKHITLDREMSGPDHAASTEPGEFKRLVESIRNIEKALGDGIKRPSPCEKDNRLVVRRSIVASRKIRIGEIFSLDNLCLKRPGTGIPPIYWDDIIGRKAIRDYETDEHIEF